MSAEDSGDYEKKRISGGYEKQRMTNLVDIALLCSGELPELPEQQRSDQCLRNT